MTGDTSLTDPRFRFRLLGQFGVQRDGRWLAAPEIGSRKGRILLELLLAEAGRMVSVDRIAEVLWEEEAPVDPTRQIATLVSRLRGVLGAGAIAGVREAYRFVPAATRVVDLDEAGALVVEAEGRRSGGEPALGQVAAERALELLGDGAVIEDDPYADWASEARGRARELLHRALRAAWESASALGQHARAAALAERAAAADPLAEEPVRAAMEAHRAAGEPARALAAYERLRTVLAEELGVDPAPETSDLHLAILRGTPGPPPPAVVAGAPAGPSPAPEEGPWGFVGREPELGTLLAAWASAAAGTPQLLLVTGEAGIGKSRLARETLRRIEAAGGWLIEARCFEAERSLFLQPMADAIRSLAVGLAPDRLRVLFDDGAGPISQLVPEVGRILRPTYDPGPPEIERRRTFDAVVDLLRSLAAAQPTALFLDDLHLAGASTFELLHYVARRLGSSRLLILGTLRAEEGEEALAHLREAARTLPLGPLPLAAVASLAEGADRADMAAALAERTRGHPLFVVEILRAATERGPDQDQPPLPETLLIAVLERLRRAGPDVEELLRAAAVLGTTFDLADVAALLEIPPGEAARRAERAERAGLLSVSGPRFAFPNDLIREIAYVTSPEPTRVERHRRAASLFADPEIVGVHATAAGEWAAAAQAWLGAGTRAAGRAAYRDAEELLDRALDAARSADDLSAQARIRLARGEAREALSDFAGAFADYEAAAGWARDAGDRRLEMAALRAQGGDPLIGMGHSVGECIGFLEAALHLAETIGDRTMEVDVLTRLSVLWTNRLRFDLAFADARRSVDVARSVGDPRTLALALDGLKAAAAYSGDLVTLRETVAELEPLLRAEDLLWHLQWTVFESSFLPLAAARWDEAARRVETATELNRKLGFQGYGAMFTAQLAWIDLARGNLGASLERGRRAFERATGLGHPWWTGFCAAVLGWILTETGRIDEALTVLSRGVAATEPDGTENYLLRCQAHLALAAAMAGDPQASAACDRAAETLSRIRTPPGGAFLHGGHAVIAVARARLELGGPAAALALVEPLAEAALREGWQEPAVGAALVGAAAVVHLGSPEAARPRAQRALDGAVAAAMPGLQWQAHGLLAGLDRRAGDEDAARAHLAQAQATIRRLAGTLGERRDRDRFRRFAAARLRARDA